MREVASTSRRRILQTAVAVAGATLVRAGVAQDAAAPYKGLGFREVQAKESGVAFAVTEFPVVRA